MRDPREQRLRVKWKLKRHRQINFGLYPRSVGIFYEQRHLEANEQRCGGGVRIIRDREKST